MAIARYSTMATCESCQIRNEAALSIVSRVLLFAWHFFCLRRKMCNVNGQNTQDTKESSLA